METQSHQTTATAVRPFRVDMPEEALADLRRHIAATRWPSRELVADRSQGVQLATIQELARYWATEHDWRACEARLNALPQFTTEIDGVDIHFIHVRSRHEDALPLIMTHGWPGSVIELLEVVGPLTDPTAHGGRAEDAFDVVLPSLPGYGFSGEPTEVGWNTGRIARAWAELMHRLGYTRYVAQGGDVGAAVTDAIATFNTSGRGYLIEQATRPQRTSRSSCGRPGSSGGLAPGRLHHVPRRDLPGPAQLGREGLPQPDLLQRGRQGRPLRRLGRARAVRDRSPGRVPITALVGEGTAGTTCAHRSTPQAAPLLSHQPGRSGSPETGQMLSTSPVARGAAAVDLHPLTACLVRKASYLLKASPSKVRKASSRVRPLVSICSYVRGVPVDETSPSIPSCARARPGLIRAVVPWCCPFLRMLESFPSLVCLPALHTDSLDQPACRLAAHHAGRKRLA
jgi:pimeloyl-ACP methyl ester carboxylesterase